MSVCPATENRKSFLLPWAIFSGLLDHDEKTSSKPSVLKQHNYLLTAPNRWLRLLANYWVWPIFPAALFGSRCLLLSGWPPAQRTNGEKWSTQEGPSSPLSLAKMDILQQVRKLGRNNTVRSCGASRCFYQITEAPCFLKFLPPWFSPFMLHMLTASRSGQQREGSRPTGQNQPQKPLASAWNAQTSLGIDIALITAGLAIQAKFTQRLCISQAFSATRQLNETCIDQLPRTTVPCAAPTNLSFNHMSMFFCCLALIHYIKASRRLLGGFAECRLAYAENNFPTGAYAKASRTY